MIGYIGLARETFDVSFAEQKFQEGKKALLKVTSKLEGFDKLITNEDLSNKALKFFKQKFFSKIIIFQTTFTDAKFILSFAKKIKKPREINLYSPEYLQKKHGISLNKVETSKKQISDNKVSFGFYNSLLLLIVIIIGFSRVLYFFQDFIIQNLPFSEFYLNYFFESMRNMFEIFKNLISNY